MACSVSRMTLLAAASLVLATAPLSAVAANDGNADNGSSSNVLKLYLKVERLEQKVRRMQGHIEVLQHEIEQNRDSQKKLYQNLNQQLNGGGSGGEPASGGSGSAAQSSSQPSHGGAERQSAASSKQPSSHQRSASGSSSAHSEYMAAFNQLKNGQYDKAAAGFKRFAREHPNSGLTDNAYYWMGESYYVQQKYDASKKAFEQVINKSPRSAKVPDSLYKIALIQLQNGHKDNATTTLHRIVDQYGDSRAAKQAQSKLKSLGG